MSDDAEIQARIAALAGQINKHKQQPQFAQPSHHPISLHHPHARGSNRWFPYPYGGYPAPHKHRSLVINGSPNGTLPPPAAAAAVASPVTNASSQDAFISTRGGHANQLMTKDTFEREQKHQQELREQQRQAKLQVTRRSDSHQAAPESNTSAVRSERILKVDGIRFQMKEDGSKLIRIPDPSTDTEETPKKTKIADVEFLRTKHGNLIRTTSQKDVKRYLKDRSRFYVQDSLRISNRPAVPKVQCENFTKYGTLSTHNIHAGNAEATILRGPNRKWHAGKLPLSMLIHTTGNCSFGPVCRFAHDPSKVAICKEYLRNGSCKAGRRCDLSHDSTYHRVPACTHFIRGNCTNSACRYPHVNISPSSRVCRPFATLGYCSKGPECDNGHVIECPDYTNNGHCASRGSKCQLPHIDRAGALRKAAQRQAKNGSEDESDLSSSDDEVGDANPDDQRMEEEDSDVADEDVEMGSDDNSHALSQQQDFVSLR